MKLLVKILIALAFVGVTLLGIGILNGGELYTALQDGRLVSFQDSFNSAVEHGTGEILDPEGIDTVHIEVSAGSCEIETGTRLMYSPRVDAEVNANALILKISADHAEIVLPDQKFKQITVSVDGGSLEVEDFYADKITVAGSLGSMEIESLRADACELFSSAGDLRIEDLDATEITAQCTGGNMDLQLAGRAQDYHCIADITAGRAVWEGADLEHAAFGGADAPRSLTLFVTAGSIDLSRD